MIWTYLRSCYTFTMRVWIGDQEVTVPARWFFTAPHAKLFPSPHGGEASPWLKMGEVNEAWGEVTPYPTDPASEVYRGLDRGINPGYAGQCYVGERQWFNDGRLPADILTRPPLPWPDCCRPATVSSSGGIVLGGTAIASRAGGPTYQTVGGLVLGGTAGATGQRGIRSAGGLVLGGSARAYPSFTVASKGGLVLGGTGTGSEGGPPPGPDCNHAATLVVGSPTGFLPAVNGPAWWKVNLIAGHQYALSLNITHAPQDIQLQLLRGPCSDLAFILTVPFDSCRTFTCTATDTYYLDADEVGTGYLVNVSVLDGPCP